MDESRGKELKVVAVGTGTTTLDMLCHNHPWLKDKIDKLERDYTDTFDLLGALTNHVDCATSEEHATDVFCTGCFGAVDRAIEHLDSRDPKWREQHDFDAETLSAMLKRKKEERDETVQD